MRISHNKLFVYVAITKTGSTSVRKLLHKYADIWSKTGEGPFGHHRTAADLRKTFLEQGWVWEKYFKFSVVRHPLKRAQSVHKYKTRIGSAPPSPYVEEHAMAFYKDCLDHVKSFHSLDAWIHSGKFNVLPMTHWTHCPTTGNLLLDQWVKLEDLHNGLHSVWEKLNLDVDDLDEIPILNSSDLTTGTEMLSRSSENWLRERFKTDFEAFGYE